jgi:hypothetical protein
VAFDEPRPDDVPPFIDVTDWVLGIGDEMMPNDQDAILPDQVSGVLGGEFLYEGRGLTADQFTAYVNSYDFGSIPPTFVVLHHTAVPGASWGPSKSHWDAGEATLSATQIQAQRKARLDGIMGYYRNKLGWDRGPHLFIDDRYIWLFSPMRERGIHAAEGNGAWNNYSIGIEVVGDFTRVQWPEPVANLVGHAVAVLYERLRSFELVHRVGPGGISSHRNYNKPSCPGNAISEAYYMDMIKRAQQRLVSGGAALQQMPAKALPPVTPFTPDKPILSGDSGGIERCAMFVRQKIGPAHEYFNDVELILGYYWSYAPPVGVDPFLAACQCIFETDSLTSKLASRAGGRNPAGLGARQEGALTFDSWENAVQAHIGQLLAFALTDGEANEAQKVMMAKNPRHGRIPTELRGSAKTLAGLNNRWTTNPDYAAGLIKRATAVQQVV